MKVEDFIEILGADFYAGVPDSQLKALCDYLINTYGTDPRHHIIAANEGNCAAIAAGYNLATGRVPVVYMQNSGIGNIVNPVTSLLNTNVYAIPVIFVIGWRGEPGVPDEPQHIFQGRITQELLADLDIDSFVVTKETTREELESQMRIFAKELGEGRDVAFVIKKGGLTYSGKAVYENGNKLRREEVIRRITIFSGDDPVISTTGKASRELFEIREQNKQGHEHDFLTVGSMGHASSIALGIALNSSPHEKIWCIDGDGSLLMHLGAIPVIGAISPKNFIHIVINNAAHETVGGMPTVADKIDVCAIARACAYASAVSVDNFKDLDEELQKARDSAGPCLIEIRCAIGAREDLGRPTIPPLANKDNFIASLHGARGE